MPRVNNTIYAAYQGDKFLAVGLMDEVIEITGIRKKTLQLAAAPSHKKRREESRLHKGLIVIRVDEDDEEDETK